MRVLIVKLHAIGDVAMCLPIVGALREQYPGVRISWLCGRTVAPLIELVGGIEVISVKEETLINGSIFDRALEMGRIWRKLFARSFDIILTCYMDSRARLFTLTALAKERRKCMPERNGWWAVPGRYYGAEYVRLVTEADGPEMRPPKLPVLKVPLSSGLREALMDVKKPLISLAPGGARNVLVESPLRRWPVGSYRLLAEYLLNKGYGVVVTGGPSDSWVSNAFEGLRIVDLVGQTSLLDLLAVYSASDAVVTHDSGPLHLALLAETPTVALFGPTTPSQFVPKGKPIIVLWGGEELPCRPCFDGRTYAPCHDNRCMKQITVLQVLSALDSLLDTGQETNWIGRDRHT